MEKLPSNFGLPSVSFCALPWVHLFADELGILRPCCLAHMTLDERTTAATNSKGEPYVVYHPAGIEEAWNAPFFKEIRRDMLSGRRPPICAQCWRDEDLGLSSYRQRSNNKYRDLIAGAVSLTATDGAAPTSLIRSIDLRLGNLCNLRCRMCSPVSSKGLINEWADYHDLPKDDVRMTRLRQLDWYSRDAFWRTFEKYVPHIKTLHFAGGEPLIIPQMFDFLERVITMGKASDITLSYNTNLTVFPERLFELWPHFKRIKVVVSVDGYDAVNNYIRYPTKWAIFDRHMHLLDTQADRLKCAQSLYINTTVQVYNIFRLDELLAYVATSFNRFDPPYLNILTYPLHYSIQILPQEMKQRAATRLRDFTREFSGRWPEHWHGAPLNNLLTTIDGVVKHMFDGDHTEAWPEFRQWTEHLDHSRGQSICETVPELSPLFMMTESEEMDYTREVQ